MDMGKPSDEPMCNMNVSGNLSKFETSTRCVSIKDQKVAKQTSSSLTLHRCSSPGIPRTFVLYSAGGV